MSSYINGRFTDSFINIGIVNEEKFLVKQHPYFEMLGLRFCLNRKSALKVTPYNLEHNAMFLKLDIIESNKEKIKNKDFYISKLLEQKIESLYKLTDFLWEQNDLNMTAKIMPNSFCDDSPHLQNLAMQDTNNNIKAIDLAINAIKCREIESPNPNEPNVTVYVDSFFQWAAKQVFFPEWFYLTSYFKELNPNGYRTAINNRCIGEYLSLEEAAKYFKHLGFDEVDILIRGISDARQFFPTYLYNRGKYEHLVTKIENELNITYELDTKIKLLSKNEIIFSLKPQLYHNDTTIKLAFLTSSLYVPKDKVEDMATTSGFAEQSQLSVEGGKLTKFISICCSLISRTFEIQDYIEVSNSYNDNKISLEIAAIALTTYVFLNKRFGLLQQKMHEPVTEQNQLANEEQNEHEKYLIKLKQDFEGENTKQEINLSQFIKWIVKNSKDFTVINMDIAAYLETINKTVDTTFSVKNMLIVTLLCFIHNVVQSTKKLDTLETKIIPIISEQNYALRICEFANNFHPITLISLAEKYKLSPIDLFQQIINQNIRWFVKITNVNINIGPLYQRYSNIWRYPNLSENEAKSIENSLSNAPFYKVAPKIPHTKETINFVTALRNIGEISSQFYTLEFPEELYFLEAHYDYRVSLPKEKYNLAITLSNIVVPENEILKLKNWNIKPNKNNTTAYHKECNEDKTSCQTIAKSAWRIDPTRTIKSIVDIELKTYKQKYKGVHTLRNWIKPLDPRSPAAKAGAPRKKKQT